MEEGTKLQTVTLKLLGQVENVLEEGTGGLAELKQVAAILKDVKDIQKETAPKEVAEGGVRVILEGDLARFGG